MACPCGSGQSLETCCGPYIKGEAHPATAETLMRARYTAYATGEVDFILSSHDPDRAGEVDRKSTEAWSKGSKWLGLEILEIDKGGPEDDQGTVEFVARYKIQGASVQHRERASFRRHNGHWVFVDGEQIAGPPIVREGPRIGRNDPCTCGSGKKYKKCCGKAA